MNPIIKNILAVIAGLVVGSFVNMGIIMIGSFIIPSPDGVDTSNMDSLRDNMHLFEIRHFIMPFLAHAAGTFVGAWLAALIAASQQMKIALGIGVFFLLGGIASSFMLPAPIWFIILDLVLAYLPMAWLGGRLAAR